MLSFGEPGGLQVQAALQPPAGGGADGSGFIEPGQLGVLRGDEIPPELPLGQGPRRGAGTLVQPDACVTDASLQWCPGTSSPMTSSG